jgi:electron transfer flavoprotein alpha subunit
MMQMADLAIVADVNEVIEALDELTSGLERTEGAI